MISDYTEFKEAILKLTDIDLNLYQEKQMKRRIDALIAKLGLNGYNDYTDLISNNKEKLDYFIDYITINVSDFFRTPDQWNFMADNALYDLTKKKKCIKAWSIACSAGEEPYSLVISMMEKYPSNDIEVFATDIDEQIIEKAKKGQYLLREMENVPEEIKKKYFTFHERYYEIKESVKEKVKFEKLNLLKYNYPKGFDLILSRNVLIYFTRDAEDTIFKELYNSLNAGGYLFTGNTEQIIYYKQMNFTKIRPFLYQKQPLPEEKKMSKTIQYRNKRTVLIVEDNEINREILSSILEDEFNVLTAENGKEGYDILSEQYKNLSLVLLDVYMPVMNGFEVLEKIKNDALLSSVPVVVTTGSDKPEDEVKCLKLGASDFITKPYNPEVVIGRIHSIIKLKESVATLSAVEYDSLTGLYTLPAFYHHASEMIKSNPDKNFNVSISDIKDFKLVNTFFGKNKADELIKYIADKYKEQIPFAILARQGDKFYSIYDAALSYSPEEGSRYYADLIENSPIPSLSLKYGTYLNVDKSLPIAIICDRALIAAQSIKNSFSETMSFYDEKMGNRLIEDQKLEQNFEKAIKNKEFVAFYQPKIDTNSGKIVAAEALVRWILPDGKMISPGAFVPLFEKDGLISKLDEYIFRRVCEYQRKRMDEGKKVVPISVNLSRNSIYSRNTAKKYHSIVDELNVPIEYVPIEITESATTEGSKVIDLADELIHEGFSLHMDDFGTGYSSLSSLAKMPFDVVKLDKSLIDRIGNEKGDILIRHMIEIAQEIGMKVVAEGVEEKDQLEFLKKAGCDMIQGFYFSAPKNEAVFSEMLDSTKTKTIDIGNEYNKIKLNITPESEIDENSLKTIIKLANEMMEGFLIYKANSEETIIYANSKLIKMFKCDSFEEFKAFTSNSFKGIVDKSEYEDVEKQIFSQVNSNKENNDAVEYHINRKDGKKVFVLDEGHCVYSKVYGNIFYVFIKER